MRLVLKVCSLSLFLAFVDENTVGANQCTNPNKLSFHLYTKSNQDEGFEIILDDFTGAIPSDLFNPNRTCFFISHGYRRSHLNANSVMIKKAILEHYDVNVFTLDWSSCSKKIYTTAVKTLPTLGAIYGDAIHKIVEHYGITYSNINMAGHSLGAHLVGAIGAYLGGQVNYIVGMDPASPLISSEKLDKRLDRSDAQYVQVIHTSRQGFKKSLGHADFYPNGGKKQPGCGVDVLSTCAHSRAYKLYAESLQHDNFLGISCTDYSTYKMGTCQNTSKAKMGGFYIDKNAKGDYYLKTRKNSPFALTETGN